jgi:hypothetical protein
MNKFFMGQNGKPRRTILILGAGVLIVCTFLLLPLILASFLTIIFGGMWAAIILGSMPSGFALLTIVLINQERRTYLRFVPWILVGPVAAAVAYTLAGTDVHHVRFVDAGYADMAWAAGLIVFLISAPDNFVRCGGPLIALNFATTRTAQTASILTAMDTKDVVGGVYTPIITYFACIFMFSAVALLLTQLILIAIRAPTIVAQAGNPSRQRLIIGVLMLCISFGWQILRPT